MGTLNGDATTRDTVSGEAILIPSSLTDIEMNVYLDVAGAYAARTVIKLISAVASTTIDEASGESEVNAKILNVTATTNFAVGETIIIDRSEVRIIDTIQIRYISYPDGRYDE